MLDSDNLKVCRTDVHLPNWDIEADGVTVGLLSDFHADNRRAVERTCLAVKVMAELQPDIVFLAGDYISTRLSHRFLRPTVECFKPLKGVPRGVYAIMGNHDYWSGITGDAASLLRVNGVVPLLNESRAFPGLPNTYIVGLDDYLSKKMDLAKALTGVPKNSRRIALIHEPDAADFIGDEFDLQLSGHTHGGQVRLPGLPIIYAPSAGRKYPEGLMKAKRHQVYTTRGIGMGGVQIRLFCPPEITFLTLRTGEGPINDPA